MNSIYKTKHLAEFFDFWVREDFQKNFKMKLTMLPAYTTITAQVYSQDGKYLAVGNDQGKIVVFKVMKILEKTDEKSNHVQFQFDAGKALDPEAKAPGSINDLKTLKDTVIVAISRPGTNESALLGYLWKDLIQQKAKLAWDIEFSSGLLPTDVNAIAVDQAKEKIFVVGGVGTDSTEATKDHALRIIDAETRMEDHKPLLGKLENGDLDFLHGIRYIPEKLGVLNLAAITKGRI